MRFLWVSVRNTPRSTCNTGRCAAFRSRQPIASLTGSRDCARQVVRAATITATGLPPDMGGGAALLLCARSALIQCVSSSTPPNHVIKVAPGRDTPPRHPKSSWQSPSSYALPHPGECTSIAIYFYPSHRIRCRPPHMRGRCPLLVATSNCEYGEAMCADNLVMTLRQASSAPRKARRYPRAGSNRASPSGG